MNKKKIIIFHPALAPYRIDFFNELSSYFEAKFYFSLENLKDQKFDQGELQKESNFKFNLLSQGFEFSQKSFRFGIHQILKHNNPEIVLCSEYGQVTISTILYKQIFNRNLKIYIISDDSIHLSIARKGFRKWIRNLSAHLIDGIIFPGENVCNWYKKNIYANAKTFELPIIHSNESFRNKLSEALIQSESNIQKFNLIDKTIFLFVGRLVKIKNVDFLLREFANIKLTNEILIIIGDGEESNFLKHLAKELNLNTSCLFMDRLEGAELISWYNIAHCLVLPSYQEPYGAVVNEALLAGCKVLCSTLAGAAELINNKNGYLFNPRDEAMLTKLIENISHEFIPIRFPILLRRDLMPFRLEKKLDIIFPQL